MKFRTYRMTGIVLAVFCMSCSKSVNPPGENVPSETQHPLERAERFGAEAEYDSALVYLERAYQTYMAEADYGAQVQALNRMGWYCWLQGDFAAASDHLQQALALADEHLPKEHLQRAHTLINLGILKDSEGDIESALELMNEGLEIRVTLLEEDDPEIADAYNNIGLTYANQGRYDQALTYYQKALSMLLHTDEDPPLSLVNSFVNMGLAYWYKGDYEQALRYQIQALDLRKKALGERHPDVGASYLNIGLVYDDQGDTMQALRFYNEALSILSENFGETHPWVAHCYNNLGLIAHQQAAYDEALNYYDRALHARLELFGDRHPDVAEVYHNIGYVYSEQGDYGQALAYYQKALTIDEVTLAESPELAISYNNIGLVYYRMEVYEQALDFYDQALHIRQAAFGSHHPDVAQSYTNIGTVYHMLGKYDQALIQYQLALQANVPAFDAEHDLVNPSLEGVLSEVRMLETLQSKASTLAQRFERQSHNRLDLETAGTTYERAITLIDHMRSGYKVEGSKLYLAENAGGVYEQAIRTMLQLYTLTGSAAYQQQAFQFAEKSKAGVLLEAFSESEAKQFSGIPDSLLDRERQLRVDLASYEQHRLDASVYGPASDVEQWQNRFFEAKQRYDALIEQFEADFPDYYNLKYAIETINVEEVQSKLLDANTALVEYVKGDSILYIFALTQETFRIETVPVDTGFAHQIVTLRASITNQDYNGYLDVAHRMYNLLLAPVADAVADKDLIIIPDAAIHYVPFDALLTEAVDAEGGIRDYRTLPYLLREKNVSYIYSATFFQQTMHRQRKTAPRDLLAFAPVFGEEAMGPQNRETGPLPASRDEVEGIDALFGTRYGWFERWFGGKTEVLLTGSATEDRLKTREAALYRYVHLATHGFVDEKEPGQSGLALAQGGRSEDGLLHLGEIYNLNLNADLVVLSACETGLGQLARGEGIIGLTRGFLYAGAANVLVSLWKVDDTTTAQLMQDFYVDLLADFPKTTALRRAKLRLIEKHPRFARPYYWSSFILIGR